MTYRARIAYQAYEQSTGEPMRNFEDLPESEQLAWANAAQAVASDLMQNTILKFNTTVIGTSYYQDAYTSDENGAASR